MVSINELVEESLINNDVCNKIKREWRKSSVTTKKETPESKKKNEFTHNFNSFEQLKEFVTKKGEDKHVNSK